MADKEKVIKGVHDARIYLEYRELVDKSVGVHIDAINNALALLNQQENDIHHMGLIIDEYEKELKKKQEAVEPIPPTDESDLWKCGNCNHQLFRCTHQRYCEMCGRLVKWDA